MNIIQLGLESLIELTRKYKHSIFRNYLRRRHTYFIYIGICSRDWLENTKLKNKIDIIEFNEILKTLINNEDNVKLTNCLNIVYNTENSKTYEPYRSIAQKLLKNMVEEFLSISSLSISWICNATPESFLSSPKEIPNTCA
jgi:hypothetical protein